MRYIMIETLRSIKLFFLLTNATIKWLTSRKLIQILIKQDNSKGGFCDLSNRRHYIIHVHNLCYVTVNFDNI